MELKFDDNCGFGYYMVGKLLTVKDGDKKLWKKIRQNEKLISTMIKRWL